MGQSITIACPSSWRLGSLSKFFERLADSEAAEFLKFDDQLQVIGKEGRWRLIAREVSDMAAAAQEYATNDDLDERFRRDVETLCLITIRFDNIDQTRRVLRAIAQEAVSTGETVWIDTDYGWVIHAWDLLKRMDEDEYWDWMEAAGGN